MADLVLDIIHETFKNNEDFRRRLAALILGKEDEGKELPVTGDKPQ